VLDLIRRVKQDGIAVIFVSHQMPDVLAVCDRVMVLRLGALAATLARGELNAENLVGYITGAKTGDGAPDPAGSDAEVS
jgi:simple sugar transport system ATP-binding protein